MSIAQRCRRQHRLRHPLQIRIALSPKLGEPGDYGCYHCYDSWNSDCDAGTDFGDPDCDVCYPSPIVIDVLGDGFNLTDLENDSIGFVMIGR